MYYIHGYGPGSSELLLLVVWVPTRELGRGGGGGPGAGAGTSGLVSLWTVDCGLLRTGRAFVIYNIYFCFFASRVSLCTEAKLQSLFGRRLCLYVLE